MGKRRKKKSAYLSGASWRDVLRGKPVTFQDLTDKRQKRANAVRSNYQCRRCSHIWRPTRFVSKPTCILCGGVMDPTK